MEPPSIVMDTNVLVAGLRSKKGASHRLLRNVGSGRFTLNLSVPLVLQYEEVCQRQRDELGLSRSDVNEVIDYLCRASEQWPIFFLWRPFLPNPKDDMVLEVALASQSDRIVTHNTKDFAHSEQLGIKLRTPKEFLREIGALP